MLKFSRRRRAGGWRYREICVDVPVLRLLTSGYFPLGAVDHGAGNACSGDFFDQLILLVVDDVSTHFFNAVKFKRLFTLSEAFTLERIAICFGHLGDPLLDHLWLTDCLYLPDETLHRHVVDAGGEVFV